MLGFAEESSVKGCSKVVVRMRWSLRGRGGEELSADLVVKVRPLVTEVQKELQKS
jgi:hypothetical protein